MRALSNRPRHPMSNTESTESGNRMRDTRIKGGRHLRASLLAVSCSLALAAAAAGPAAAGHQGPFGTNFGLAEAVDEQGNHVDVYSGPLALWAGTCDTEAVDTGGTGMGTPPSPLVAPVIHCIDHGTTYFPDNPDDPDPPIDTTWQPDGGAPAWRLNAANRAGGHPDLTLSFRLRRWGHSPRVNNPGSTGVDVISDGEPKDVLVRLPAGLVGDPNAVPQCPAEAVRLTPPACPPETQVGISTISLARGGGVTDQRMPVWNVEPRKGKLAEFIIAANINESARVNIPVVARARTDGDFGIDALALNLPPGLPFVGQTVTIWGVPYAASHDKFRPPSQFTRLGEGADGNEGIPVTGLPDPSGNQPQRYEPSWGPVRPFLVNPTECAPVAPSTGLSVASWRDPTVLKPFSTVWDAPVSGCGEVPFGERGVGFGVQPTSLVADGPTGLTADVAIPQVDESPFEVPVEGASQVEVDEYLAEANAFWKSDGAGLSTAQLEEAVVTLPEGVSVNPAGAAGLAGCSDSQFGLVGSGPPAVFNNGDPFDGVGAECPAGSRIGTVEVYTPILPLVGDEQPGEPNLHGDVVLGSPRSTDPLSGEMFRLLLVVRNRERGLVAKIAGSAVADPVTGQLTTTFERNPRVPFETMRLRLKGGDRGTLALQQRCVARAWTSVLTPWTAAHGGGGSAVSDSGAFAPTSNCAHGFAPRVAAGMSDTRGGGSGAFSLSMSREDGEQWLRGLTAELPLGLVASIGDVPLCSNAQAAAGACPAASRVGAVDAGAGSGTPYFLEKKGSAYLTEGYKGAPYGLATVVPVEAGPFSGQFALRTMVVRQAIHVDRSTAKVTVVSDPFPQIWHGIPLRVRRVTVKMDRAGFMRNPTDCSAKQILTTASSTEGAVHKTATPFQASGCARLAFKPKLALRLTGKRQTRTGKHPGVRAAVTQQAGQAGIERVQVRLPKVLALDPDNARALCEFTDGTKPDLENHCPRGSIVGRARAVSPLLSRPLSGNVYFVKNVRISENGNPIRTLPMIVVALRGEIAINVRGVSSVARNGRLINTFNKLPDAPISQFNMNLQGGNTGILVVTDSARGPLTICGRQIAETDIDAHNGRRADQDARVKTPCKTDNKAKTKKKNKGKRRGRRR